MNAKPAQASSHFGPWNPGIRSPVPEALRRYCTIFLPDNVFTSLRTAVELHDLTGLEMSELVAFRPRRLMLHELLIRVTADLGVPDGERIEDLGINFRQMTRVLLARLEPHANSIITSVDELRQQLKAHIDDGLLLITSERAGARSMQHSLLMKVRSFARRRHGKAATRAPSGESMQELLSGWEKNALATQDELKKSSYRALLRVVTALFRRHGALWGSRELIAAVALDLASNEAASELIGRAIEPLLLRAAVHEGYSILPAQAQPVIMNTKGPSASGKSTLRPLQKQLAGTSA